MTTTNRAPHKMSKDITPPITRRKISILEAADFCGVTDRTIREWIKAGILPAYRYGTKIVRIDPDDLERLGQRIPAAISTKA